MRAAFLAIAVILAFGIFVLVLVPRGETEEERDVAAMTRTFILQAFSREGDTGAAYALLDPQTRGTCSYEEFEDIAELGRVYVDGRKLEVDVERVQARGDTASTYVHTTIDGTPRFPWKPQAGAAKVDGEWYYTPIDRSCDSEFTYFTGDLSTPGTPVSALDAKCHPAYPVDCVPHAPPILTCAEIGMSYILVLEHPDPHNLDPDGNGFGCERSR